MARPCNLPQMPPYKGTPDPCDPDSARHNAIETKYYLDLVREQLETIRGCLGGAVKHFRLTEPKPFGVGEAFSAAAVIQRQVEDLPGNPGVWIWQDDPSFAPIEVFDDEQGGEFAGDTNYQGDCVARPSGTNHYRILFMDQIAQDIEYQLTDHLISTSQVATVLNYKNGLNPGSTVTVYDPLLRFTHWHRYGCKGKARWNRELQRYEITEAQFVAMRAKAGNAHQLCTDDQLNGDPVPPGFVLVEWMADGNHNAPWFEFVQTSVDPDPVVMEWVEITEFEMEDWCKHRGAMGSNILVEAWLHTADEEVEGDVTEIRWNVYDMELKRQDSIYAFEQNEGTCTVVAHTKRTYLERCDDAGDDLPVLTMQEHELLESVYAFSTVGSLDDPETWVCQLRYTTGIYCTIRKADGTDDWFADFERREYMTDWDVVLEMTDYRIKYHTEYAWVPCWYTGQTIYPQDLEVIEYIDLFVIDDNADGDPPSCDLNATTLKTVTFDMGLGAGADKVVAVMHGETVVSSVIDTGTTLDMARITLWVLCSFVEEDETITTISECT